MKRTHIHGLGKRYPPAITRILNDWVDEHDGDLLPIPMELTKLCDLTGLSPVQVRRWFSRRRQGETINTSTRKPIPTRRSGAWTPEECLYAFELRKSFLMGVLSGIPHNVSLRKYLSRKLNCSPLRISYKYRDRSNATKYQVKPVPESGRRARSIIVENARLKYMKSIEGEPVREEAPTYGFNDVLESIASSKLKLPPPPLHAAIHLPRLRNINQ